MKIETYKKIILGIGLILLGLGAETFSQYYYFDNGGKTYQQGCNETVDIRVNTNGQNARAGRFHLVLDPTTTIYEMSDNVSTLRSLLVIGSSQTFLDWSAEIIPSWKSGTNKTILQIDRSNATTDYNGTNGLYATIKFKPIFNVNNYDIAFGMEYNGLATGSDSTIETTLSKAGGIELINPSQQNLYRTGTYQVLQEPCVADTNKPTISNLSITNGSTKKSHISGLSFSLDDNEGVSGTGNVPYIKTDGSAWTENIGGTISNQYGIDPNTLELQLSGNGHSIIITNTTSGVSISWDGKTWQNNGLNANVTVAPETLFEFGIEKKITATFTFKDRAGNTSGLTINFNSPKGPTLISNSPIPGNGDVYVNLSDPIKLGIKDDWAGVDSGTIKITLSGVNGTDYGPYEFTGSALNLSGVQGGANTPDYYINISNHEQFPTSGTIKVRVYAEDMEGNVDTISDYTFITRPNCSEFQCCDPVLLDLGDGNLTYYTNTGLVISGGVNPTFSGDEQNITGVIDCNTENEGLSVYTGEDNFMFFTDESELTILGTGVKGVLSGNVLTLSYIIDSAEIIVDKPSSGQILTTGDVDIRWHLTGVDDEDDWLSGYYIEIYSGDILITGGFVDGTGITESLLDGEYEFVVYPIDLGGHTGSAATGTFSIDTVVPSVVITGNDVGMCSPAGTIYTITGTFSEAVTGIDASTLTVTGGTVQNFTMVSGDMAVWTVSAGFQSSGSANTTELGNGTTVTHNPDAGIHYVLNSGFDTEQEFTAGTIIITDGTTTITMLDRNLGATAAGTGCTKIGGTSCSANDPTYGYHFQWGNNYGFNPNSTPVTGSQITTSIVYNPFYTDSVFRMGSDNWLSNNSVVDLWGGSVDYNTYSVNDETWKVSNPEDRQGPCPEGFHVPSRGELDKIETMMGSASAIHNDLLVPFAGDRNYSAAKVYDLGSSAYLWSSSPYSAETPYSRYLFLDVDGDMGMGYDRRAGAYSVRCVYNSYQTYTKASDLSSEGGVVSVMIETGTFEDLAGNANITGTDELSWDYDGEGPEFVLDDVERPECTDGTMTISGVTQVGCASGHESPYSWDAGDTWGLTSTNTAYSGGIGEKIMTVRVRDAFGNYTEKTGKYTWTNVNPSVDNISVGNVGLGTGINWRELSHAQEGACGTGTIEFSGFISSGDHGTCTEEGGIITYTPNIGEQYEGEDSCIFEITDDEGNTATGEITFTGIDTQKPTAELHGGVGERCTSGNTFTVTGTFSEEVLGVTMNVLTGENVNIVDFTGNGNVYEWAVEMQGGTGKVWINSGAIVDVAGNNIEGDNELILGIYDNMKPRGVSLIAPEYNQEFNRRSIAFEWSSSVDDGCAGLSGYILNICRDSLCDDIVETIFTNNTGESITLQNNDNYYWRVISVDNYGNKNTGLVSYFIVESNEPICTITQSACSSSSVNLVLTGNKEISILSGNVVWQEVLQDRYSAVISDNIDVWAIVGDFDNQTGYCHLPVTNYDNVGPDFEFEIIEVDEGHSLTINIIASDTGCAGISGYNFGGIFGSGEWQNGSGLFISADDIGKTGGINKEQVISVIDNLGNITTKTGIIRINDIIPVISQNMLVLNGVYTGEAIIDIVGILGAGEGDLGTGDLEVEISGCTNVTGNISGQVLIINLVEDFEGTGSCTVRIKDNEGSYADVDGVIEFVVDTKKPECTGIIFEPEGWTSGDVVNVSLTGCSEPIVSGTITYVFTGNGSYLFEFEDSAGNVGSQLVQFTGFDRESPIFDFNSSSGYECQTGILYISNAVDSGVGLDDLPYSFDLINRGTLNSKEVYSSGVNEIYLSGYVRDKLGNYGVLVAGYIFNDSLPSATGFSVYALTGAEVNWKELSKASDGLCGDYNMTATVTGGELGSCSISGDILSYIVNVDNTGEDSCSLTIYDDEGNNIDIEVMFLDINNYPYTELVTPINGISMNPGKISFAWSGMGNETFVLSYVYTIRSSDNEYIIEQTGLDISIDLGVGAYRWNVYMKYIDGTTGGLSDTYSFNIVSKPSGGGGGGGGVLTKDNCPDGDFSNSHYDGMCDSNGGTHGSVSVDICGVNASNYSLEQKGAYLYSYVYGITTMCPIGTANLDGYLIRSHFAKMISEFAVNILGVEPDIGKEGCDQFDDIGNLDKELHDLIVTSCELGLMGLEADGLTPSKSFNPNGFVTRAQFGTVLSRLLFGDQYNIKDESKVYTEDGFWYKQHLLALKAYGIMTKIDGDWPNYLERRGRVMLMLQRADNYGVFAGRIPAKNGVKALFDE